jgi:hypothetical protein
MPTLSKRHLEELRPRRFGPDAKLETYGAIGKETSGPKYKQYGYGVPVRLNIRVGARVIRVVLENMSPGPFGHEHMADRAQAIL